MTDLLPAVDGVAVATDSLVYPAAVGGDIGCGMAAARFDVPAAAVTADPRVGRVLLERLGRAVPPLKAAAVLGDVLGATLDRASLLDCDHNHVTCERHGDRELMVHRKGALPAGLGQAGLVPGSMGTASFRTVGRGHPDALCSSSHGAGRVLPRGEAAARIDARRLVREMHGVTFDSRRANRLVDEAPTAYRDIRAVMRAQRELTAVVRELRPLVSYKA